MTGASTPTLTPSEFLEAIYGADTPNVWVCAFDRVSRADWTGFRFRDRAFIRPDQDNYFCIGLLEDGATRRASASVVRHYLVFADDVGTKVDPEKWEVLFAMGYPPPTFRIETSPGNQTWVWVLAAPVDRDDAEGVKAIRVVREQMAQLGLSDPLVDDARYIRLPWGHNSKDSYVEAHGAPVPVRLIEHNPGARLDIAQAATILAGPDWRDKAEQIVTHGGTSIAGALHRTADMNNPEPIIQLAQELGMNPVQVRAGVVEAICPNAANHTNRTDSGFAFLGNGLMECNHGHCSHLRTPDFTRMMMEQYDQQQEARLALGLPLNGPATAREFLAERAFAYHDKGQKTASELEDEAARMEAESERAVAAKEAQRVQSEADLARRFAWVEDAALFFDTETRKRYTKDQFEALGCVVRVIPPGSTGAKRASNRMLTHPDMTFVSTFAYKPGDHSPLVDAEDEFGQPCRCANTWVGPNLSQRPEQPATWLQHVAFIYDDPRAYEFVLDFMAWVLQHPTKRTSIVPVLIGDQGVGKDMVWSPIIDILGAHNVMANLTPEKLVGQFNDYLEHRLLIMPELRMTDRRAYDAFKDITSVDNRLITINRKHAQPYKIRPAHVVICMTNNTDAIANMDPTDRRVWVHETKARRLDVAGDKNMLGSQAYFQHVKDTLETKEEKERVFWFLMNRDVSRFNPHAAAPDFSGAKQSMLLDTLSPAAQFAYESVQKGGAFEGRTILTTKEVTDLAVAQGGSHVQRFLSGRAIRDGLTAAGCVTTGQRGAGAARIRLWFTPWADQRRRDQILSVSGAEPRRLYDEEVERWKTARLTGAFPAETAAEAPAKPAETETSA